MMDTIRKPLGYVAIALGLIVAAQFIAYPIYADEDGLAWSVWGYINIGTATGTVIALVVAFQRWYSYDRDNVREFVASVAMLMFAVGFALMFVEQWFSGRLLVAEGETADAFRELVWIAVDVLFPVLVVWVGTYLLRDERTNALAVNVDGVDAKGALPESIGKPVAFLLYALGLILAVQFIAFPFYVGDDGLAWRIWNYVDIGTAVGTLIALGVAFLRWRVYDRSSARESIAAGAMFMFAGASAIMFFEQWATSQFVEVEGGGISNVRALDWIALDVSFPVLAGWVGTYLLRRE